MGPPNGAVSRFNFQGSTTSCDLGRALILHELAVVLLERGGDLLDPLILAFVKLTQERLQTFSVGRFRRFIDGNMSGRVTFCRFRILPAGRRAARVRCHKHIAYDFLTAEAEADTPSILEESRLRVQERLSCSHVSFPASSHGGPFFQRRSLCSIREALPPRNAKIFKRYHHVVH